MLEDILQKRELALSELTTKLLIRKNPDELELIKSLRNRHMTSAEDCHQVVKLIDDLVLEYSFPIAGICRISKAYTDSYYRWKLNPDKADGRTTRVHSPSSIAIFPEEQNAVITLFNQPDVRNLNPEQAILELLDKVEYLCSSLSVRRVFAKLGINGTTR